MRNRKLTKRRFIVTSLGRSNFKTSLTNTAALLDMHLKITDFHKSSESQTLLKERAADFLKVFILQTLYIVLIYCYTILS